MLLQHVYEQNGVLFNVEYDPQAPITIHKVQVLGHDYKPTGPDLAQMLHEVLVLTDVDPPEATRFLSLVTEEISEYSANTAGV